jgi:hypothetical protein
MAIGAMLGYEHANAKALDLWHDVYGSENLVALTDTFTTEAFFKVSFFSFGFNILLSIDISLTRISLSLMLGFGKAFAKIVAILLCMHPV